MTLVRGERVGLSIPEVWRRMFDSDLEAGGWLRIEEFPDGDSYVVRSELPWIDPERDVELSVVNGVLHITARREERSEKQENGTYRSEFRYGTFQRSVPLPDNVREDDIKASYKDGILEVRVPAAKDGKSEPKKIPISKA
jgi:HSP20 family protein